MLTKWFGNRSSRSLEKEQSFRPWLESLEERNAPGGGPGPGGDNDHGHGPPDHHQPPPPPPHQPAPPPGPVNNGVNNSNNAAAGNGNHGSFNNSTITGSFNNTINNTINNTVNVTLTPGQSFAVEGLFGISGFLSTAMSNPNLGALLNDEIAMAVDNYLTTPAVAMSLNLPPSLVTTLSNDATALSKAIGMNTLGATPFGQVLGMVAYDVTLDALTSAGP